MGDFIWGIDAGSLTGSAKETSSFQRISTEWVTHAFLGMTRLNRTTIAPIVRRLFRMRFFTQAADDFYLKLTRDAAKLRQSGSGGERSDYLAHLLQLQEKGASLDDMVGHALTVLMDGFETSSAVLYHMLYTASRDFVFVISFHYFTKICYFDLTSWALIQSSRRSYAPKS